MAGRHHAMGRRRAEDAAMTLFSMASASRTSSGSGSSCSTRIRICRINPSRPFKTVHASSAPRSSRPRCQHQYHQPELWASRRQYATLNDNGHIAVVGGGLTGLTTAYYLAKQLPSTAKITLYEGSDRLGGWIQTDRVPVDVDGVKGTVSFERGPRTLSSLHTSSWRFDDLILYDLVSIAFPLPLLSSASQQNPPKRRRAIIANQPRPIYNRLSISASRSLRLPTSHAISTIQTISSRCHPLPAYQNSSASRSSCSHFSQGSDSSCVGCAAALCHSRTCPYRSGFTR